MSNLGEWIEEKAIEKTTKELILNMHKYGLSLEKIADIVEKDISEVQEIISNSWLTKRQYSVPRCIGVFYCFNCCSQLFISRILSSDARYLLHTLQWFCQRRTCRSMLYWEWPFCSKPCCLCKLHWSSHVPQHKIWSLSEWSKHPDWSENWTVHGTSPYRHWNMCRPPSDP